MGRDLALTLLYVPADRPELVQKALTSGADVVAVDLEDAVAPRAKDRAREGLARLLGASPDSVRVQVRINPRETEWHEHDVAAVGALPERVEVRVPKIESVHDVALILDQLPARRLHVLLESARGVENAFEIAQGGVASIGLGEADLRSQLGLPDDSGDDNGLSWQRSRVVNAAAAAGLLPPMMSVYANVRDIDGLTSSSRVGRAQGFVGRAAIHPVQLPAIRGSFAPTPEEIERAAAVVSRLGGANSDAAGIVVLDDGSFLDAAMVGSARRTLELAKLKRFGERNEEKLPNLD